MKKFLVVLLGLFCLNAVAAEPAKKVVPAKKVKVKVMKPCKEGQSEKDGCHVVKKQEPVKPKPKAKAKKK